MIRRLLLQRSFGWRPSTIRGTKQILRSQQPPPPCRRRTLLQCLAATPQLSLSLSSSSTCFFSTLAAATTDDHHNGGPCDNPTTTTTRRRRRGVRNVAIVAHVDHGKTTLVQELLKQCMLTTNHSSTTTPDTNSSSSSWLDTGELEQERGITITSKVTRLQYTTCTTTNNNNASTTINVVDTPGHADFAGEVDRILSMVDGVVLVVDANEGPMAQTKYVLSRALQQGLQPLVVLNKVDRPAAQTKLTSGETESALLDLFDALGATEEQMNYTTLYASAKQGWVSDCADEAMELAQHHQEHASATNNKSADMTVLLNAILEHIPEPTVHVHNNIHLDDDDDDSSSQDASVFESDPFSLAATTVGYDSYLGRTCTGRIYSGAIRLGDSITVLKRDATASNSSPDTTPTSSVTGLFVNRGLQRVPLLEESAAIAGDIVTLAGVPEALAVGDTVTLASSPVSTPIETPPLAPPTLSMEFGANTGPLAGITEGQQPTILTSSKVKARLVSETDNNVTLTITDCETDPDKVTVYGRGELQLGILIEQMRREGYELLISPPKIVTKVCPQTKKKLEPFEEVTVDVDAEFAGTVIHALTNSSRKGVLMELHEHSSSSDGKTRLVFEAPSRSLLGFGPEIATATRGTAVVNHVFLEDREYAGNLNIGLDGDKGKLVSNDQGKASLYALSSIAERGTLFIEPGEMVYAGMVIGESNRTGDMDVNPVRAKATSNVRTVNKDEKMYLAPPKRRSVEELIGYMNDDEILEVTPTAVRLRKVELDASARARAARTRKKQLKAAALNAENKKK